MSKDTHSSLCIGSQMRSASRCVVISLPAYYADWVSSVDVCLGLEKLLYQHTYTLVFKTTKELYGGLKLQFTGLLLIIILLILPSNFHILCILDVALDSKFNCHQTHFSSLLYLISHTKPFHL